MEQPGNASLLEMWHEQMQVRTLHEQNQHLLDLVKRVKGETQISEAGGSDASSFWGPGIASGDPFCVGVPGRAPGISGISGESVPLPVADLQPRRVLPCLVLAARRGQLADQQDPHGGCKRPEHAV